MKICIKVIIYSDSRLLWLRNRTFQRSPYRVQNETVSWLSFDIVPYPKFTDNLWAIRVFWVSKTISKNLKVTWLIVCAAQVDKNLTFTSEQNYGNNLRLLWMVISKTRSLFKPRFKANFKTNVKLFLISLIIDLIIFSAGNLTNWAWFGELVMSQFDNHSYTLMVSKGGAHFYHFPKFI